MAQLRASTVQQVKVEVHAALQYAASFHCLVEEWKDCAEPEPKLEKKSFFLLRESKVHRTEWSAPTSRCRCTWCGKNCRKMRMQGQ